MSNGQNDAAEKDTPHIPTPPAGSSLETALKRTADEAASAEPKNGDVPLQAEDKENADTPPDRASGDNGNNQLPAETSSAKAEPGLPAQQEPATPPAAYEKEEEEEDGQGGRMSLMDHLRELRRRLFYCIGAAFAGFLLCWTVVEPIFNLLIDPLLAVLPSGSNAMYTTLPEAFFTRMYIAFIAGLFVASPFIFYQIWAFISPGLYEEEKRFIIPVAVVSAFFFIIGGLFCYFIVFHYAFNFFMSFTTQDIVAMPKISDYLDFVLKLILAFGFIFEMPIFSFFLSRMGVVTADKMRAFRRYAILLTFIVAAILTPPDVVSQLLMAFPMLLLYEVSILIAACFGKKTHRADDGSEDNDA